jgi:CheY-like chemotaxis protein
MSEMSTRKILLVDDSRSARYALRLLLQKHNFEVDTAESAESALEKVKQGLPDAIFMDHLMPGMNGFEALEALKADNDTKRIPVVMCTSNDDESYQRQARDKGALGILPKPATPERLSAILSAIDGAIVQSQTEPPSSGEPSAAPAQVDTPPAAPGLDAAAVAGLIKTELQSSLDDRVRPLIDEALESARDAIKRDLSESLLASSAEQLGQWMEAEVSRLRSELAPKSDDTELSEQLKGEVKQLKNDLVKMESDHAHALTQRISNEVLPELLQKQMEEIEQRVYERLEMRLGGLSDSLIEQLPNNDSLIDRISAAAAERLVDPLSQNTRLIRQLNDAAEAVAEQRAEEIATRRAEEVSERLAEAKAAEVVDSLAQSAQTDSKRMYLLAGAAAAVGVLSSLLVYLIA